MALHLYNRPHPGLSATPSEREWTRDMDDMLRLHLRRSGFDFEADYDTLHQIDALKNFLVRLHPKYPAHIKAVPALLWARRRVAARFPLLA